MTFEPFIQQHRFAVVLLGASWAARCVDPIRPTYSTAAREFDGRVAFGEIDVDDCPDIAGRIPIVNVPAVAYYKDGQLLAALIGANQDVVKRVAAVIEGKTISQSDGRIVTDLTTPC